MRERRVPGMATTARRLGSASALLVLVALPACAAPPPAPPPVACAPAPGALPSDATLAGGAGEYRVRLVATAGARRGRSADGSLRLWRADHAGLRSRWRDADSSVAVSFPLSGATDVDLAEVGALRLGDPGSEDADAPGVVVAERHGAVAGSRYAEITLRLGSEANRPDLLRPDGGYTVLRVRRIAGDTLGGTWESGADLPIAEGYFCAWRQPGRGPEASTG